MPMPGMSREALQQLSVNTGSMPNQNDARGYPTPHSSQVKKATYSLFSLPLRLATCLAVTLVTVVVLQGALC